MTVKFIGIRKDDNNRPMDVYEAKVPGYEYSLIEFGLRSDDGTFCMGSKYFMELPRKTQDELIAKARQM